ncbi:hypothetical protein CEXT_256761 [Caerostris extrusa]|uniref:Uncharacterized protein n=1 Tax=Caerostris extrusa TaxID=172846 RepID=A0AAV4P4J9_CAEEX|nr:hypothetical protein CEXT_256761 [Caerostris extrusa]
MQDIKADGHYPFPPAVHKAYKKGPLKKSMKYLHQTLVLYICDPKVKRLDFFLPWHISEIVFHHAFMRLLQFAKDAFFLFVRLLHPFCLAIKSFAMIF